MELQLLILISEALRLQRLTLRLPMNDHKINTVNKFGTDKKWHFKKAFNYFI